MDFAARPPEVNSGLMYTGPGSGSLRAAAAVWKNLAAELHATAAGYESVVSELTSGPWQGPASISMASAISPLVTWFNTTATQAEQTAVQATAAASAYESAFALTVPPPVIAANRAQLMMLIATNVFGQNGPAIAATETHYEEMWSQDGVAMEGYAAAAPARQLTPFQQPPQKSDSGSSLNQATGAEQGGNAQSSPSQMASTTQGATSQGGTPTPFQQLPDFPIQGDFPISPLELFGSFADHLDVSAAFPIAVISLVAALGAEHYAEADFHILEEMEKVYDADHEEIMEALGQYRSPASSTSTGLSAPDAGRTPLSANMGQALSAGRLSVPQSWAEAAPEIRAAGYTRPIASGAAAAPKASPAGLGAAFGQMAAAGMAGSGLAGAINQTRGQNSNANAATSPESPQQASGSPSQSPGGPPPPPTPVAEFAAGVRELGKLRDAGYLTEDEFAEQKQRLLGR